LWKKIYRFWRQTTHEPAAVSDLSGSISGLNYSRHDFRRLDPVSRVFGFDRGLPIDRYFIEQFLEANAHDIRGRVLEIADNTYTRRFGGNRVSRSDVLATQEQVNATYVGDLSTGRGVPDEAFDCIILTQTLNVIYDVKGTIATCHRCLTSGGVVLATLPCICQISRHDMDRWGDYWRFTTLSARKLFEEFFCAEDVLVQAHGNVFVAVAFLHGLASEELSPKELEFNDPDYQVLITVRALKTQDKRP
jgi:hypothetical protein